MKGRHEIGKTELSGDAVIVNYFPTLSTEETSHVRLLLVPEGLAEAYRINLGDGYATSIHLECGEMIYDQESLADAIDRMNVLRAEAFIRGEEVSIEEAAMQVAREDGRLPSAI